ncbi:hypothetical protein F7C95_05160 [Opitutia bacterium ISCC 51]|nr:hypothetical protein F7C95_05160 [Opitutae bacterium ISCC 51]QXD29358.1 hypothetical protein GA003_05140 [Opitutae bacterium ISCC 52]
MIKNLLLPLVTLVMISGCATLSEKPDPFVGVWEIQFSQSPGGNPNATLMIKKKEGVYSGTLSNPTGEYKLNELSIEANGVLSAGINYRGYSVELSATMDGNSIAGQNDVQGRTFEFTGEKVE